MSEAAPSSLTLAIDTCSPAPGVALASSGELLEERYLAGERASGELTASLIAECLAAAGASAADVTTFAVTVGPGSYTGVRVGLGLVRGLALAGDTPVVGIDTLEVLARASSGSGRALACVLDAGRGGFYLAAFRCDEAGGCEPLLTPTREADATAALARLGATSDGWLLVGEGAERLAAEAPRSAGLTIGRWAPRRAGTLALAAARAPSQRRRRAPEVLPLYVGAPQARPNRARVAAVATRLRSRITA